MGNTEKLEASALWEVTQRLVSFNTVSALSNTEATNYLANLLEEQGFTIKVQTETIDGVEKTNLLAWAGPSVENGLIISGHTDVVPFEGQPGWTHDPLQIGHDGERLFGRGVSDMKVFLAQAVLAAKRFPLSTLKRPLLFLFTCDEEVAGQGSGRLVAALPQIFTAFPLPKFAIIGEPTNFAIFPAHKGYAVFDIVVQGKGGHSSAPQRGLNAIEQAAELLRLLRSVNANLLENASEENKKLFPEYPASVFNAGLIRGGLAPNMIADSCRLTVSVRIAPGDTLKDLQTSLWERIEQELLPAMRAIAPESGIQFEPATATPPLTSPLKTPFSTLLSQVMEQPVEHGAPYATDGGQFEQLGIQSYICGPGLLEQAHQPNESISSENFLKGQEKLEQLIQRWCVDN